MEGDDGERRSSADPILRVALLKLEMRLPSPALLKLSIAA